PPARPQHRAAPCAHAASPGSGEELDGSRDEGPPWSVGRSRANPRRTCRRDVRAAWREGTAQVTQAPIRTFWWRWKYPHRLNFGDEITAPLVERITGRRVTWADPSRCDLVGAGSVVQMILRKQGSNQPKIWGSGLIRAANGPEEPAELDLLAVRGRQTLGRVRNLSAREVALGDPGMLAPLFVEGAVRKRYSLGVIPHYHDVTSPVVSQMRALGPSVRVIDVAWTPQEIAREIAACDAVISSSLHGLIF